MAPFTSTRESPKASPVEGGGATHSILGCVVAHHPCAGSPDPHSVAVSTSVSFESTRVDDRASVGSSPESVALTYAVFRVKGSAAHTECALSQTPPAGFLEARAPSTTRVSFASTRGDSRVTSASNPESIAYADEVTCRVQLSATALLQPHSLPTGNPVLATNKESGFLLGGRGTTPNGRAELVRGELARTIEGDASECCELEKLSLAAVKGAVQV